MRRHLAIGIGFGVLASGFADAQVTARVSVSPAGAQGNDDSFAMTISADGRYVAFYSRATGFVAGDTNGTWDVFVRDRSLGTTELVSVAMGGSVGNGESTWCSISADGRYVAFASFASNLVPGDVNGQYDVFIRDRQLGTTELASVDGLGVHANFQSYYPAISADGRYVSFSSFATNLVPGDTNAVGDIFVRDRQAGTTERVSVASSEVEADADSDTSVISADGRFVAFSTVATNLSPAEANLDFDVVLRDRLLGTTEQVSVGPGGLGGNSFSADPSISADGRFVVFTSSATDLVAGDVNGSSDTFVRDRLAGTTALVSLGAGGIQGNASSSAGSITPDGRYVAFASFASNLVAGDTNAKADAFVRDLTAATTTRVDVTSGGVQANDGALLFQFDAISADANVVVFTSHSTNLVPGDSNGKLDAYVRDALGGPGFTSVCDPGAGGVVACPCGNPPGGAGTGCDNSAATGGAMLAASGGTILSSDSLAFTASGELAGSMSVLFQGGSLMPSGFLYGQGVRCAGIPLLRLFSGNAVGGSVTLPNFVGGDGSVSARAAAKGHPIAPGQSRWYFVAYRDPAVLGGCPAASTFNSTQTGRVEWAP